MSIKNNIQATLNQLIERKAKLIAVSKTKPTEAIMEAYKAGIKDFGENKVQELIEKYEQLPKDIQWHMIGHLQRNKVKYIAPFVHLIHGVDSLKLLKEINKEGKKANRRISCLLQVHIAEEENKFGFSKQELEEMLQNDVFLNFQFIEIRGLMGMATFTEDKQQIRKEFKGLSELFFSLKDKYTTIPHLHMEELSMGMSGDYTIALEEGSTMVRVGSAIFGAR